MDALGRGAGSPPDVASAARHRKCSASVRRNRGRLERRFVKAVAGGTLWLAERRDLFDAHDSDAGVYFVECLDDAAVDEVAARCGGGNAADRLLGVYDLRRPLAEQGGGLSLIEWAALRG